MSKIFRLLSAQARRQCSSPRLPHPPALTRIPPPIPRIRRTIMTAPPTSQDGRDLIFVRSLNLKATTGVDSWRQPRPQPILLSLWLKTSVALAGSTDHLPYSIHYGTVCKAVTALVEGSGTTFRGIEHLAEEVAALLLGPEVRADWVRVVIEKPRALLRADAAGIEITRSRGRDGGVKGEGEDKVFVNNLRLVTIIGVNPWEREERQNVVINLTLHKAPDDTHYDFHAITKIVSEYVERSDYKTVEAFVTALAREACVTCGVGKVTVRAEKPSALTFAAAAGVEITREREFFALEGPQEGEETEEGAQGRKHDVFIALGSNLGDRYRNISDAVVEMERRGIRVRRTSSLYQSAPMYVTDQPTFLNGVCQVETTLSPESLLAELKSIETQLGRVKTMENGPRTVDLDILLYDALTMSTPTLTIPHTSMLEREFVLRPLCDIAPNRAHPLTSTAFKHHLTAVVPHSSSPLRTYVQISPTTPPLDPSNPSRSTLIMAVLNLTPDSFSDGGVYHGGNLLETVRGFIANGADIIDIGGQSTRPGAQDVGEAEELRRVIPAIRAIRDAGIDVPISVDTFRAGVAEQAIKAGANIINDISAGLMDSNMLSTVAKLNCPIVLMHTRGTPETMNSLCQYGDVVKDVTKELEDRVAAAEEAGIRRWNILLDPGLGFAKDMQQNLELLRRLGEMTGGGFPWVLGPSRKRFVGKVTRVSEARERQWGTAGAVAACVAGGADVVRVHDVQEMRKVVDMAVAIWRK